jgi:hypothetical protein
MIYRVTWINKKGKIGMISFTEKRMAEKIKENQKERGSKNIHISTFDPSGRLLDIPKVLF